MIKRWRCISCFITHCSATLDTTSLHLLRYLKITDDYYIQFGKEKKNSKEKYNMKNFQINSVNCNNESIEICILYI